MNNLSKMLLAISALVLSGSLQAQPKATRPNIVLIYADDLGYGDLSCYGGEVKTPNADRLARNGLRFTDGYATSATCTPSRYSMLTGEYAFRQKGTGILPGDAALIIEPGRATLPSLLREAGYKTGVVGKWHLGLGKEGEVINWNTAIKPGPPEIGFDYSFIMAATGDRVPCVYLENHQIVGADPNDPIEVSYKEPFPGEPDGVKNRDSLKLDWSHGHNQAVVNGIGRIGYMKGGTKARWNDETMADEFNRRAVAFIEREKQNPFFLFFALHDVHVPRVPHPRFVGKSGKGPRGDAILQFDDSVGQILAALDKLSLTENTLVLLSSDNGPVLDDGYKDQANEKLGNHKPSGPLRGGKYSAFDGGTRVPFIVHWPARIKPGTSGAIMSQVDFPATFAALAGLKKDLPKTMPDTQNQLPALLGETKKGRAEVVLQARQLSLRSGEWKYVAPGQTREQLNPSKGVEVPEPGSLFNVSKDPHEKQDLAASNPKKLQQLKQRLEEVRGNQRD